MESSIFTGKHYFYISSRATDMHKMLSWKMILLGKDSENVEEDRSRCSDKLGIVSENFELRLGYACTSDNKSY